MRKFWLLSLFFMTFLSSLFAFDGRGGATFMMEDDPTGYWPSPIDVNESITLVDRRMYANIQCGATPYRVRLMAHISAFWWKDSVIPGDTFNLYLVFKTMELPDDYELYSNFGLGFSFGEDFRTVWTPWGGWGDWVPGPSLGIDFNINVKANGLPPMMGEPGLKGDDVIDFLSLVPDIEKEKREGTLRDAKGATIKAGAGDVLGLFDIASIRFSGGWKIDSGHIMANVGTDELFNLVGGETQLLNWLTRTDTIVIPVAVKSYAQLGEVGKLYIKNATYYYVLLRRIGLALQAFGYTVASTYWIDNDFYENMGTKTAISPSIMTIAIPVTGVPDNSVDVAVKEIIGDFYDYRDSLVDRPERDGLTDIKAVVCNSGPNSAPHVYIEEIITPDTQGGIVDTVTVGPRPFFVDYCDTVQLMPIDDQTNIGQRIVGVYAYTDTSVFDIDTSNNRLYRTFMIQPKHLYFRVRAYDSITNQDITNTIDRVTLKGPEGVMPLKYDSLNGVFRGRVEENNNITVTAIPDSLDSLHFVKSVSLNSSIFNTNDILNILLSRYGKVAGRVLAPDGDPVDSVSIKLGADMTITDSAGYFYFSKVIPAIDTDSTYYILARHTLFRDDSTAVVVHPAESIFVLVQPASIDTTPPVGSLKIIGSASDYTTTTNVTLRVTAHDDVSWMNTVEVQRSDGTWQRYQYSETDSVMNIPWTLSPQTANNEYVYVYVRFSDMANNLSDPVMDSILLVQQGPTVTNFKINNGASLTNSRDVTLSFNAQDPLFVPVAFKVNCNGTYSDIMAFNTTTTNCNLSAGDGNKTVYIKFMNSAGVWGNEASASITLSTQATLVINNGAEYTSSSTVNLSLWGAESYVVNNLDSAIDSWNYYPVAQTFIPHTDLIRKLEVPIYVNNPTVVAIMEYDSFPDGSIQPTTELASFLIDTSGSGTHTFNPPVAVDSQKGYAIVIYDADNGMDGPIHFTVWMNNNRYSEGKMYYGFSKSKEWYDNGDYDIIFAIINPPTDMIISNNSDLSGGTGWIPYQQTYAEWSLPAGDGVKTVYAQLKNGNFTLPVTSDRIFVDHTPPESIQVSINSGAQFTQSSVCTLYVHATDDYSGVAGFTITESGMDTFYYYHPGIIYPYKFRTQNTGTKNLSMVFKDRAGNESSPVYASIDFDSTGLDFTPLINGGKFYVPSETVTVTLNLGKSVTVDSVAFSEDGVNFSEWESFSGSKRYVFSRSAGWQQLYVKIKDNYGVEKKGYTQCYIDKTPPLEIYNFKSNRAYTDDASLSYTYFLRGDPESGINRSVLNVFDNESNELVSSVSIEGTYSIDTLFPLQKYHAYYGQIETENKAGLVTISGLSGLTYYDSPPSPPQIVSPDTGEVLQPVEFKLIGIDNDPDTVLCFKIDIAEDSEFTQIVYSYDGKDSVSGWSKERYAPEDTAVFRMPFEDSLHIGQRYYFRVYTHDSILTSSPAYGNFTAGISSVDEIPATFFIRYLSPNPARGRVHIMLGIPAKREIKAYITDIQGRVVKTLYSGTARPGILNLTWKGASNTGGRVPSGIYFINIKTQNTRNIRKIIFMRK